MAQYAEDQLRRVAALTSDEQMVQDADLFRRYQVILADAIPDEIAPTTEQDGPFQPQRWGPDVASTPDLPVIEVR